MSSTATISAAHTLHPSIIREYDIRGIVGETLSVEDAFVIGRAFATEAALQCGRQPTIVVGRDGRLSSPEMTEALQQGLMRSGAMLCDIGIGPTPMTYFAAQHLQTDAAIMVTGSHNPPSHNGFKLMLQGKPFYGAAIRALAKRIGQCEFVDQQGSHETSDICADYVAALLQGYQPSKRSIHSVWDAGNGAAGEILQQLARQKTLHHHCLMNEQIDGTFPHHHPDPSLPENLIQLQQMVQQKNADVGLAFDGDADRLGVVDDKARIVSSDHLLLLFAQDVLKQQPGATIIADVKTSQMVFDGIAEAGGTPLMWMTGHSHIKHKMKEVGAAFAGEASGHIFFADRYYGFDDGIYAAIRLVNLLSQSEEPLSAMIDRLPVAYSTPEIRIDVEETRKFAVIDEIRTRLDAQGIDYLAIDGVRVMNSQGWWLIRASNTQAAIIARAEAASEQQLQPLIKNLAYQLQASGVVLPAALHS